MVALQKNLWDLWYLTLHSFTKKWISRKPARLFNIAIFCIGTIKSLIPSQLFLHGPAPCYLSTTKHFFPLPAWIRCSSIRCSSIFHHNFSICWCFSFYYVFTREADKVTSVFHCLFWLPWLPPKQSWYFGSQNVKKKREQNVELADIVRHGKHLWSYLNLLFLFLNH